MSQEEFLLKWNDHHASFFTIVEDLCRTEQLCDVTLACGGQVFETHKLILSVCSPYFRTLLNSRPDKHPIVYLKDVNPKHLEQLLSYMYRGEINVLQDDLGPLIETARGLQIKGLADAGGDGGSSSGGGGGGTGRKENNKSHNGLSSQQPGPKRARTTTPTPAPKMPRIEPGVAPGAGVRSLLPTSPHPAPVPITRVVSPPETEEEEDDGGIVEVDPGDNPNIKSEAGWMMSGQGEDSSEYEIPSEQFEQDMQAEDEQYIQAGNDNLSGQQAGSPGVSPPPSHPPGLRCPTCDKQFSVPSILERHMRTHTQERPHTCSLCGRGYSQSGNLNVHLKTVHGIQVDGGRARCDPEASRPHKCYICNRLFTTSSNMYQHIRAVHNIAIETSKSPRSVFPFNQSSVNVSLPASLPRLSSHYPSVPASPASATNSLDNWAKAQLEELRSMTSSSSPSSAPPPQLPASLSSSKRRMEPTIQDTLQQLKSLAGSKETGRRKGERVSIYSMDQDKPIAHRENEDKLVIKQEGE